MQPSDGWRIGHCQIKERATGHAGELVLQVVPAWSAQPLLTNDPMAPIPATQFYFCVYPSAVLPRRGGSLHSFALPPPVVHAVVLVVLMHILRFVGWESTPTLFPVSPKCFLLQP